MAGILFIFVGASEIGRRLIENHNSVIHKIDEAYVPPLEFKETAELLTNVSAYVEALMLGTNLEFAGDFVSTAHQDSGGYPYLSQRFGYHAINDGRYNRALVKEDVRVSIEDCRAAVTAMFGRRCPGSEIEVGAQIKDAVGDAKCREAVIVETVKSKKYRSI